MRIAIVAIFAGSIALGKALDPSWSFASTTTITDEATLWYTVSVPFLTTVTTDVSGGAATITTTKVSISIGTEPPNIILATASTSDSAAPYGDSVSRISFGHDGDGTAYFLPVPTKELLGFPKYYRQLGTTENSDVLHTLSSTTSSDGEDVTAYTASGDGTGTATDTTTAEQTTDSRSFAIPSRFILTRPAIERSTTEHPSTPMRTSVQYDTRRFSRKYSTSSTAGFTNHITTTSVASSGVDFNTGTYDETSGVSFTTGTYSETSGVSFTTDTYDETSNADFTTSIYDETSNVGFTTSIYDETSSSGITLGTTVPTTDIGTTLITATPPTTATFTPAKSTSWSTVTASDSESYLSPSDTITDAPATTTSRGGAAPPPLPSSSSCEEQFPLTRPADNWPQAHAWWLALEGNRMHQADWHPAEAKREGHHFVRPAEEPSTFRKAKRHDR